MKKLLVIVIALVIVLTLAAGCGNKNDSSIEAEESLRGSASALDAFEIGDATLEDINTFDAEGSFRGSAWSTEDWVSVADN